ncbi:MAG: BREX-2 system adenine-specific DNA-methyltransferase PglX [Acidimicrobiales bacterium]
MIDAPRLLRDLQGDLGPLVSDLGTTVKGDEEVRAHLDREWRTAFDAHRTGRSFEDWLEDRLTQVAVAWLLACVFVRFCEDNLLIDEAAIGGHGERGDAARAAQQRYFTEHPHDSDREYLHSVFRAAAALPSLSGLLADGENPLWLVDPPADACTRLLTRFRATDDAGNLVLDFTDPAWSTRFLGDLYQDLSRYAKDTYALLQTPDFVEEFILDRTLTPAIETFGLARTTLIDPTCGSGHFLLGAFSRLFGAWREAEPGAEPRVLAQRALAQVTGVDLNPFAAAIARFRLLVAALRLSSIQRLADAPDFAIDVAVGDSLLWGARPGQFAGMEAATAATDHQFLYRTEHADILRRIFDKRYTAVVGNPPYIVCRDPALNREYRNRYGSCHRQYSLGVPFTEEFFDLAELSDTLGRPAGYVGMITTNSFMKREFGTKLIEQYIPKWDLTHVVDTAGAYLPGFGTPTVILLGRRQAPALPTIRTVMGIRGEPSSPAVPAKGLVWTAIVDQIDEPGSESDYVSVADTDRIRFSKHPWSIGGGGAAELKEQLDLSRANVLREVIESIGSLVYTRCDDAYLAPAGSLRRVISALYIKPLVEGESVRDYGLSGRTEAVFPYDDSLVAVAEPAVEMRLWPYYQDLISRREINGSQLEIGLTWFEFNRFLRDRYRERLSIAFSSVATHNHFVLDRGGKVFTQTAPVIKLPEGATVDEHLGLVGLLNSAVGCFWTQQVSHNKGSSVDAKGARQTTVAWDNYYAFDGTKLQRFPLPLGSPPVALAGRLDSLANDLATQQPVAVCAAGTPTRARLDAARSNAERIFGSEANR